MDHNDLWLRKFLYRAFLYLFLGMLGFIAYKAFELIIKHI